MTKYPPFPDFKPLELKDRALIEPFFLDYQPETSEMSFTNLFLWRKYYNFRWSVLDNFLLVTVDEKGKTFGYQPVGNGPRLRIVEAFINWLSSPDNKSTPCIIRADQRLIDELRDNGSFQIEPTREHFDYVYRTEDLSSLQGRKYHSKRNHLNRFLREYSFTWEPFTESLIRDCLDFCDRWCRDHHCSSTQALRAEWISTREIILNYRRFQLMGAVIRINGRVEAFTFAEMLNRDTAVIHIEKASSEFHGIYAAINQLFCSKELSGTRFVNREQDLGNPGLQKAKKSYYPVTMVKKYRIMMA